MNSKLPSLDFINNILNPNTGEIKKPITPNNGEIIKKENLKLEKDNLKKPIKEISPLTKKTKRKIYNKSYYSKHKERILEHKSRKFKAKSAITRALEKDFKELLHNLLSNNNLQGTYTINLKNKNYTFRAKITSKKHE